MHSWSGRLSAVFSFACGILLAAVAFNAASHYLLRADPAINIQLAGLYKMGNVQLTTLHQTGELHPQEHGVFVHFNLTADFTPAWTWGTHQIFVMVIAEFETATHTKNHVVLWDKIITSKDDCILSLPKESPEYPLTDNAADLSNLAVNLIVKYDVTPIAGPWSLLSSGGLKRFSLPSKVASLPTESLARRFYAPNTRPF